MLPYDVSIASFEGRTCPQGEIGHARDGLRGQARVLMAAGNDLGLKRETPATVLRLRRAAGWERTQALPAQLASQ